MSDTMAVAIAAYAGLIGYWWVQLVWRYRSEHGGFYDGVVWKSLLVAPAYTVFTLLDIAGIVFVLIAITAFFTNATLGEIALWLVHYIN